MFLLLYSHIKASFTSLPFLLIWSFHGFSSEIITLFLSAFIDFERLMMFSVLFSGLVDVLFKSFVPQCKMTLLYPKQGLKLVASSFVLIKNYKHKH